MPRNLLLGSFEQVGAELGELADVVSRFSSVTDESICREIWDDLHQIIFSWRIANTVLSQREMSTLEDTAKRTLTILDEKLESFPDVRSSRLILEKASELTQLLGNGKAVAGKI